MSEPWTKKTRFLKGFEASGVFWDDVCQRFAQVTPPKKWGVKLGNQLQYIKKTSWPRFCGNFQGLVDTWPWWNFDEFCCFRYEKKTLFWIEILHSPGNDQHILFPAGTLESNFFVPCPFRWDRDMWSFLEGTINLVGQHYLKKERRPSKKSTKIHPFTKSNIQESPAWEAILWFGNLSACPPHYHHQCDSQHIHPILHAVPSNRKTVNGVTAESHQKRS